MGWLVENLLEVESLEDRSLVRGILQLTEAQARVAVEVICLSLSSSIVYLVSNLLIGAHYIKARLSCQCLRKVSCLALACDIFVARVPPLMHNRPTNAELAVLPLMMPTHRSALAELAVIIIALLSLE